MPYRITYMPLARRQITSWGLSDFALAEVYLRLGALLGSSPLPTLTRTESPFDGMCCGFDLIDPENRLCRHAFLFHVFYGQDEETLYVARGAYFRTVA